MSRKLGIIASGLLGIPKVAAIAFKPSQLRHLSPRKLFNATTLVALALGLA